MNPNQILTPNSHKNVPPAVAEFLHRLKSVGKANSKKVGAILLCALALTGATKVAAESSAPSVGLQTIKVEGQQIALNDGRKMSFAELEKLPNKKEKEQILESMTDDQYNQFDTWQKNKYEEIIKEVMKDNARKDARHEEVMKEGARIDARHEEAVKEGIKLDIEKCGILRRYVEIKKPINSKYKALVEKYAHMNPPNQDALYILKYGIFEKPKP